jgi:hypothetical protein
MSDDEKPKKHPDLFDWDAARAARDEAIERVDDHADPEWKDAALDAVHAAALQYALLTSEHVIPLIDPRFQTHDLRALGPVFRRGVKAGWIVNNETIAKSARRHMSPITVWRSRVYEGAAT